MLRLRNFYTSIWFIKNEQPVEGSNFTRAADKGDRQGSFQEDSTSDKEIRDLTPARRRWREGSRGGSITSNNGAFSEHIRSILWKLAYKQLGPEDWKKLALHWAFTNDQIRAIEHQYTGKIIILYIFYKRISNRKREDCKESSRYKVHFLK